MRIVNKLIPQGQGLAPVLVRRAVTVEFDWDVRQKSRFDANDSLGRQLGVFLPRGSVVRGGDVLVAEDGGLIKVLAAPQPVLVITHCTQHGSPFDLLRAAYHLGNRHVAIELKPDHLKIEPDHVLAAMLRGMHLIVNEARAAFEPEGAPMLRTVSRPVARIMDTITITTTITTMVMATAITIDEHPAGSSSGRCRRLGPVAVDVAGFAGIAGGRVLLFRRPGSSGGASRWAVRWSNGCAIKRWQANIWTGWCSRTRPTRWRSRWPLR